MEDRKNQYNLSESDVSEIEDKGNDPLTKVIIEEQAELKKLVKDAQEEMKVLEEKLKGGSGNIIIDADIVQVKAISAQIKIIISQIKNHYKSLQNAEKSLEEAKHRDEQKAEKDLLAFPEKKDAILKKRERLRRNYQRIVSRCKKAKTSLIFTLQRMKKMMRKMDRVIVQQAQLTAEDMDLRDVNEAIDNANMDYDEAIKSIEQQYHQLRFEVLAISRLETAKKVSTYLNYGAAASKQGTTAFLAYEWDTFQKASSTASVAFYPVTAVIATVVQIFSFFSRVAQYRAVNRKLAEARELLANPDIVNKSAEDYEEAVRRMHAATKADIEKLEEAKKEIANSLGYRFLAILLNTSSVVLALGGIGVLFIAAPAIAIAAPILAAVATVIYWVDDELAPYLRAKKELQEVKDKYGSTPSLDQQIELDGLARVAAERKSSAQWKSLGVLYMICLACAPIPVAGPIIALIGTGLFGIACLRSAYVTLKPLAQKLREKFKGKKADAEEEVIEERLQNKSEIELDATINTKLDPKRVPALLLNKSSSNLNLGDSGDSYDPHEAYPDPVPDSRKEPPRASWMLEKGSQSPKGAQKDPTAHPQRASLPGAQKGK